MGKRKVEAWKTLKVFQVAAWGSTTSAITWCLSMPWWQEAGYQGLRLEPGFYDRGHRHFNQTWVNCPSLSRAYLFFPFLMELKWTLSLMGSRSLDIFFTLLKSFYYIITYKLKYYFWIFFILSNGLVQFLEGLHIMF